MPKSPRKKPSYKPPKPFKSPHKQVMEFPQAKGRTVERIELIADPQFHCVCIRFQDQTDLDILIDPALTFTAELFRWKGHNHRRLRRWPPLRSEFRRFTP